VRELGRLPHPAALVVDGPLGPTGAAKPGAVFCAVKTGRPLRALGAAARRAVVLDRLWSKLYIPLPFTRVVVACDAPLWHQASASSRDEVEHYGRIKPLTEELTGRLAAMRKRAVDAVSGPRVPIPRRGAERRNRAGACT
jgi:hypothetical protein